MKTTLIDLRDLRSPLSAKGVEKQLAKVPGGAQVDVNYASGRLRDGVVGATRRASIPVTLNNRTG